MNHPAHQPGGHAADRPGDGTGGGTALDRAAAFREERQAVLDLVQTLDESAWATPSMADGWLVRDVIAHLAATAHHSVTFRATSLMFTRSVERYNDRAVARRSGWRKDRQIAEYESSSRRFAAVYGRLARSPAAGLPVPLGDLGRYPARLLVSAAVFDHHTHLRHDIAPALHLPAPPTDATRMAVVLEWMFANLARTGGSAMDWLDQPVTIDLTGPGAGSWTVSRTGRSRLRVTPGRDPLSNILITGGTLAAPLWMTGRGSWQEHDIVITGDRTVAARFLDSVKIT